MDKLRADGYLGAALLQRLGSDAGTVTKFQTLYSIELN
jgi:hypothetical protein